MIAIHIGVNKKWRSGVLHSDKQASISVLRALLHQRTVFIYGRMSCLLAYINHLIFILSTVYGGC